MEHTLNIVVGDWSNDGHGQTETFSITSNLNEKEIQKAYKKGTKILGFDWQEVCQDYEDNLLLTEHVEKLLEHGIDAAKIAEKCGEDEIEEEGIYIYTRTYFTIWCEIVALGEPAFGFKEIGGKNINIGGYGLFH